ncbi:tyrosine-type recombinase/integrase [Chitinolyticbacter meiyuanensis]|uniref:tyrosine-type recombinase/integrase n=1 Tax=Chitinolyticbacter meiyuanensis TaxID=682798 RepID=UPI0011E5C77B|nr:site-specific integrase [Chitinolyticbacter meiyuanensis]
MATYRKRSSGWRAEVARKGVRDSGTFDTKAEAVAWATQREAEILAGENGIVTDRTLADAFERYGNEVSPGKRGARWELTRLRAFQRRKPEPFFPFLDQPLHSITAADWAAWRDRRLTEVGPATVNREMNLVHSVLEIARREWQWIDSHQLSDVRRPSNPPPRDRRISDDEIERMCLALGYIRGERPKSKSQYVAVAFLLALETAMRASELCGLTWDRINLSGRYVTLQQTKNGDRRNVPLSRAAIALFQLLDRMPEPALQVTPATLDVLWRRAREQAVIADLHFHDSRHEALTRLAKKLGVLELARMVGHRDLKSLMIYYNATATEIAAQLD